VIEQLLSASHRGVEARDCGRHGVDGNQLKAGVGESSNWESNRCSFSCSDGCVLAPPGVQGFSHLQCAAH